MKLVIGCARSGTKYMARALHLGHECLYDDYGISSWLMAARHCLGFKLPPLGVHGPVPDDWQPTEVIHVVRHPLKQIASATVMRHGWLAWAQQYVDIGYPVAGEVPREQFNLAPVGCDEKAAHLRVLMRYWLRWNALCEGVLRVPGERGERLWELDVDHEPTMVRIEDQEHEGVAKDLNSRAHPDVTWADLVGAGDALMWQVFHRARAYGYEIGPIG